MKKILITLLLALPLGLNAQKNLDGLWGLNFYMSQDAVKEIIKVRTGKIPDENSGPDVLGYKNCDFGGQKAYVIQLVFQDDKLYGGDIIFTPSQSELLETYNNIVAGISRKYHLPQKENCFYSHASMNDANTNYGNNPIMAIWNFPPEKKLNPNARITAAIEDGVIKVSYRDGHIFNQLITAVEKNKLSDY